MVCYSYMYITIINLYTKFCLLTNTDITTYTYTHAKILYKCKYVSWYDNKTMYEKCLA